MYEIERKFIVEDFESVPYRKEEIYQGYIAIDEKREERVRSIVQEDGTVKYVKTIKEETENKMKRKENEWEITSDEFISNLEKVIAEISKTRLYFRGELGVDYTIDLFDCGLKLLEVELEDMEDEVHLERVDIIEEVTNNLDYRNKNLARRNI